MVDMVCGARDTHVYTQCRITFCEISDVAKERPQVRMCVQLFVAVCVVCECVQYT